ncbi:LPP20 family lipoprotein [Alteromonas sp. MTD1]
MSLPMFLRMRSVCRFAAIAVVLGITGCGIIDKHVEYETIEPDTYPTLTAIGYAPIMSQRGESDSVKRIMAMKASKLDAYRELAEQVYGQKLQGDQVLSSLVVESETLRASVEGVIRGAKVVKAYPVGDDTYVTELSLDMKQVYDLYLTTAKPRRVREVKYY